MSKCEMHGNYKVVDKAYTCLFKGCEGYKRNDKPFHTSDLG